MTSLDDIDVQVQAMHGNVQPILNEVLHALDRLIDSDESTTIDLASLPFAPGELETLEASLASGEVSAQLDALGTSSMSGGSSIATSTTKWSDVTWKSHECRRFCHRRSSISAPAAPDWANSSNKNFCGRKTV